MTDEIDGSTAATDDTAEHIDLDHFYSRFEEFERSSNRKRWAILLLSMALVICLSGWWLTSQDQAATERNGAAADCRSRELGRTLDLFQVIVSPNSSDREREAAADTLGRLAPLQQRYEDCRT